jgi:hypothetical protein
MTTSPETYPQTLEEAQAVVDQIAAAERLKNLYELDVLNEATAALSDLAEDARALLAPIAARSIASEDIGRLNGLLFQIDQASASALNRATQLKYVLNAPPPTPMPVLPTPPAT